MRTFVKCAVVVVCLAASGGANVPILGTRTMFAADETIWKRVERFDPGTRVKISVDGGAPAERYFVRLNEKVVVVLNLTAPELPKRQLRNMAMDNPTWMANASTATYRDNGVRVGPDGVFVKDKKIAELSQVVEWIPRSKVTSIQK